MKALSVKNVGATLCAILVVNLLSFFWAKALLSFGSVRVREKVLPSHEERKYIEIEVNSSRLIILELDKEKTEVRSFDYYSPNRDFSISYGEDTGGYLISYQNRKIFFHHGEVLAEYMLDNETAYRLNEGITEEEIWVKVR